MGINKLDLPPSMISKMPKSARDALGLKTKAELWKWMEDKNEHYFQDEAQIWLTDHGFESRNRKVLRMPMHGWWMHMVNAEGNPIVLDFLIWTKTGHAIEVELKAKKGKLRKNQEFILSVGGSCVLVRTMQEFISVMEEFIKKYCVPKADALTGDVCHWKPEMMSDEDEAWRSDCGEVWSFFEGDPADNDVKFCQGCGRRVEIQPVSKALITEGE